MTNTEEKKPTRRVGRKAHILSYLMLTLCLNVISCGYTRYLYASAGSNREKTSSWELHSYFLGLGSVLPEKDEHGNYRKEIRGDTLFYYILETCTNDTSGDPDLSFDVSTPVLFRYSDDEGESLGLDSADVFSGGKGKRCIERFYGPFSIPIPRPDTIVVRQRITVSSQATGAKVAEFPHESIGILRTMRRSHINDFLNGN